MSRYRLWIFALLAALLVLGWQTLTVQANYGGNWTGLFRTGGQHNMPSSLIPSTLRSAHPSGYDGQFYRFLAYDPFLRGDTPRYLDSPLLRSRRILVPMTVWLLAAGQPRAVDTVFILVIAACVFLGVYWLGKVMEAHHRPAAFGLLFLVLPATLIAMDTMTVDVTLAALTACFAWQLSTGRERWLWFTLAAACLVRETGLLLPAACALAALLKRDYRKAALWMSAVLPALAWYAYVHVALSPAYTTRVGSVVPRWTHHLSPGILLAVFDPAHYPNLAPPVESLVRALDSLALFAMLALGIVAAISLRTALPGALGIAIGLHLGLMLALMPKAYWESAYGYARNFTPLFVLLFAGAAARKGFKSLLIVVALCLLVTLRVGAELESQVLGVFSWVAHALN